MSDLNSIAAQAHASLKSLEKKSRWFSAGRLISFLLVVSAFVFTENSFLFAALPMISLIFFLRAHRKVFIQVKFTRNKLKVLGFEEARKNKIPDEIDSGFAFESTSHSYSDDLSIKGPNSLYSQLNRSFTTSGKSALHDLLMENETTPDEVRKRQNLVRELEENVNWIVDTQTHSFMIGDFKTKSGASKKTDWNSGRYYPIWQGIVVIASIVISQYSVEGSLAILFILAFINYRINKKSRRYFEQIASEISGTLRFISKATSLNDHLIQGDMESPYFNDLKAPLVHMKSEVKQLKKSVEYLEHSSIPEIGEVASFVYVILNSFLALDTILLSRVLCWQNRNAEYLQEWTACMGKIEAYASVAMFSHSRKTNHTYPKVLDQPFTVSGSEVRHPLLDNNAVSNDITIENQGAIKIITGSNMAGKSTFLRTIGLNLLLGKIGSRVSAKSFSFYPHFLVTSFNIKDNLATGESSFLMEVRRLKYLIDRTEENYQPLFLLDEILKGTNSKDRVASTQELISKLSDSKCFGYISTHDLGIAERVKGNVHVFHLSSKITENSIKYDYKLQSGVSPETNGHFLMKREGVI